MSCAPKSAVVSTTQTTRQVLSADPALLRLADALKARYGAKLTYLSIGDVALGKPPQPATADPLTEYRR